MWCSKHWPSWHSHMFCGLLKPMSLLWLFLLIMLFSPLWPSCLMRFLSLRLGLLFFKEPFLTTSLLSKGRNATSQCFQNLLLMILLFSINALYYNYWCISVCSQPENSLIISISQHSTVPGIQRVSRSIVERTHSLKKMVVNKRYYSKEKEL